MIIRFSTLTALLLLLVFIFIILVANLNGGNVYIQTQVFGEGWWELGLLWIIFFYMLNGSIKEYFLQNKGEKIK